MVYNCRGRYESSTGGASLTGAGAAPDHDARDGTQDLRPRVVFTLVLALVAALVLASCGAGDAVSSSGGGNGGTDAGSSGSGDAGGETAALGTPSLGREDAPVVLTEYSDYQ